MAAVIVIVVAMALIALIFVSMRIFVIERLDPPVGEASTASQDEEADAGEQDGAQDEPAEMVDVFDYFNDEEESGDEEEINEDNADGDEVKVVKKKKAPSAGPDEIYSSDKLTDLKNGRSYLVDCKRALENARDEGHIYCAVYFDYDRFSYINNLKGNAIGDYVLTNTAQHARRIFPENALITRISCDHFAAVFPLMDLALFEDYYDQLRRMGEKIRNDIAAKSGLRLCVGFATTDNDNSYDINVLLTRANVARHCFKVTKADKFETYDESMITSDFFGDSLLDNYNECQYADDFAIYFELQMDITSDKVVGCNPLVRWSCEDSSSSIITQDTGYIPTNNDKVIYHVCRNMSRWRKAGRETISVFASLTVIELFKTDIDEFLVKCLTEFQIDPSTLVVCVNAALVRLDWSMCSKQFKKLREIGVRLCVSGMDTGYSSLEFLAGLGVDFVKLHRSYALTVDNSTESLDKCRKMIERANSIGAKVVFEGVDTIDQVTALRKINAKFVQGRYAGRPALGDDLTRDLPEHVERRETGNATVILDEAQLSKGEWTLF